MDDIGRKAVQDQLLVSVVSDFHFSHQLMKDKAQVTKKLRDGAKLLMEIQGLDASVKDLRDVFHPKNIDTVISACQSLCKIQDIESALKNPNQVTVGMNGRLSWVLEEAGKKAIDDIYCSEFLTEGQKLEQRKNVKFFREMLHRRWKFFISTNLENVRRTPK